MAAADLLPPTDRTAVIVPAYQAAATVAAVVTGAEAAIPGAAIYVVDDGSTDATATAAAQAGARVLRHAANRGKGAALAGGIARALEDGAAVLATLDADGQHPPAWLPRLLAPVRAGRADLVLGARARSGPMPMGRRLTNWLSSAVASRVAAGVVPDAQTGLRAFSRALALAVRPALARHDRYEYEAAFLLEALRAGFRVQSVAIPTIYQGAPSHFHHWGDGWRVARVFGRYFFGTP
jgi:glycosyltransferase involved in cell wall biosynthesis